MRSRCVELTLLLVGCSAPAAPTTHAVSTHECGGCHAAQTAEWASSLHHASFTDGDFQRAFAREPLAFCESCHAPRDREEGVGCTHRHETRTGARGHARTQAVPCARCHEFDFPDAPLAMQSTGSENAAAGGRACADCHLPMRAGHRDHRFAVTRNPAWLRAALAPPSMRREAETLVLVLSSRGVGHALPTGDLFRQLRVKYWTKDATGAVVDYEERLLSRRFGRHHGASDRVDDTRLQPQREERFPAHGVTAHVVVLYERVAAPTVHDAELFDSITLAEASWPL